jgi:hypothetical protein
MLVLLAILALACANQQVAGFSPTPTLIEVFNTTDCTGPVVQTLVDFLLPTLNTCYNVPGATLLIKGATSTATSVELDCPGGVFKYGAGLGSTCNSTAPMSQVCLVDGGQSAILSCLPDICKPEPGLPKTPCDNRVTQCGRWGYQMKW